MSLEGLDESMLAGFWETFLRNLSDFEQVVSCGLDRKDRCANLWMIKKCESINWQIVSFVVVHYKLIPAID